MQTNINHQAGNCEAAKLFSAVKNSPAYKFSAYTDDFVNDSFDSAHGIFCLFSRSYSRPSLENVFSGIALYQRCNIQGDTTDETDTSSLGIKITFTFTLVPKQRATENIIYYILQHSKSTKGLDRIFIHIPNLPNFTWLEGAAMYHGFLKHTHFDTNRLYYINILHFNSKPAHQIGICQDFVNVPGGVLREEPNLGRSTGSYCLENGGPLVKKYISWLIDNTDIPKEDILNKTIFAVRTSILGHGQMPSPDGLHCDFPERDEHGYFTSNMINRSTKGSHYIILSGPSYTRYYNEECHVASNTNTWRGLEQRDEYRQIVEPSKAKTFSEPGAVVWFGDDNIHTATQYIVDDPLKDHQQRHTRLMIRASYFPDGWPLGCQPLNEIQSFSHIYLHHGTNM